MPDHTGGAHPTTSGQMEWTYSYNLLERLNVSRNVQPRHFLIELFRREIDIVVVSPEAGMIAELEEVCSQEHKQHQPVMAELS